MTIGTKIFTAIFGKKVGTDMFGNKYFTDKDNKRRWVVYKGISEASKVPADWHRWLHKTTNDVPSSDYEGYEWEKSHTPNLSGTEMAYVPKGHVKRGGKRDATTGDYEAWEPKE